MHIPNIPIISDFNYTKTRFYKEIIESISSNAASFHIPTEITYMDNNEIDWDKLPPVVIVTPGSTAYLKHAINGLRRAGKRIILAGLDPESFGTDLSCISPSRNFDTFRLIRYLQNCGRGRIALVGFRKDLITDMTRYYVAVNAIKDFGDNFFNSQSFFLVKDLDDCMKNFLACAGNFNAVVCPNNYIAIYLVKKCKENGICIPGDLYIATFSIMCISEFFSPGITAIEMDFSKIGSHVLNILQYITDHIESDIALCIHLPSRLMVRDSTGKKPEKSLDDVIGSYNSTDTYRSDNKFSGNDPIRDALYKLENCFARRDELDLKILNCLFGSLSYEAISEKLFISLGSINYRVNKIYKDADVSSRAEFEDLVREIMGTTNPFANY